MHTTPVSLLHRLQQHRNTDDWYRLIDLVTPLLYHWCQKTGSNGSDGEDLVQDTLLTVFQHLSGFKAQGEGSFRRWLHTILLNKWRDQQRKEKPVALAEDFHPAISDGLAEWTDEEFRQHLASQALKLIQRDYDAKTWKGFWETVVAGRPIKEVARELGTTSNAIYLIRARVLSRLREELADLIN